jgi:AcrR family transcriptional regulator
MAHDEVEAHVRRLWRHRGTTVPVPQRGPRGELDLDEILTAAIGLADANGLTAVSTRAVATCFGKTPMALYAYVGSKENLLALMVDQASALPPWDDPGPTLADDLLAWATAFFDLHLAHPWLTERGWAQAGQGPNEQDWLERLLGILDRWSMPAPARSSAITMLYATVRATAETAVAYRRMADPEATAWLAQAEATRRLIPDLSDRYPHSIGGRTTDSTPTGSTIDPAIPTDGALAARGTDLNTADPNTARGDSTNANTARTHPTDAHPTDAHPTDAHPTDAHPTDAHPTDAHPTGHSTTGHSTTDHGGIDGESTDAIGASADQAGRSMVGGRSTVANTTVANTTVADSTADHSAKAPTTVSRSTTGWESAVAPSASAQPTSPNPTSPNPTSPSPTSPSPTSSGTTGSGTAGCDWRDSPGKGLEAVVRLVAAAGQ